MTQLTNADLVTYIVTSICATVLFVFVFYPARETGEGEEKTRLAYLYERKDVIYENLRDLNFEHKAGKFTEADFEAMRTSLEDEAAGVLSEIDRLESVRA